MNAPYLSPFLRTIPLVGLSSPFTEEVVTQPLPNPYWIAWNDTLAQQYSLPPDETDEWLAYTAGIVHQAWSTPYSGHQFGVWAGQLGDGRAHLIGGLETPHQFYELQIKGAGITPFSRFADGRAVLRSSIREYLASEAMAGLAIPTTRALSLVGSPLLVQRETLETAACVMRMAPSFLRFGHIEHFAHHQQPEQLIRLLDFVIQSYYPQCAESDTPYIDFFKQVIGRTARLIAQWQSVGFCHGVMNTDNMSLLGLTLDYGPYGFLDHFNFYHRCNHSDQHGRHAYHKQPEIGFWNCAALASALWTVIPDEFVLREALNSYHKQYDWAFIELFRKKLGLLHQEKNDLLLINTLLKQLHEHGVDFTLFFRCLSHLNLSECNQDESLFAPLKIDLSLLDTWLTDYRQRLQQEESQDNLRQKLMLRTNPKFILRNHLAEEAIQQAQQGNFQMIQDLKSVLDTPFNEHPAFASWASLPPQWAQEIQVNCSS